MKAGVKHESPMLSVVRAHAAGETIAVLSTDVGAAFPLVNYSGADWGLRYNSLWLLPGLYADRSSDSNDVVQFRDRSEMGTIEREFFDAVITDMRAHPPKLLIIDRTIDMQGFRGRRFDLVEYFRQDRRFAMMFDNYDSVATVDSRVVLKR
jgi:hypothetical protein